MKEIISCSRRTDIPAFYYEWLQEKLKEQKVVIKNLYNHKPSEIDLNPDHVHSIVLWSKNYSNFLKKPGFLERYNLFFNFTVNGYSKVLEPHTPDIKESLWQIDAISKKYSPRHINWRFDPIIISTEGEWNSTHLPGKARLNMFEALCRDLSSFGIERVTTSFLEVYPKVEKRFAKRNFKHMNLSNTLKVKFAERMTEIAGRYKIQIYSCSNVLLESVPGIKKSSCINGCFLEKLFGEKCSRARDFGQRKDCGCTKSRDIGMYVQNCGHHCLYCYANMGYEH
ncbi:MAG: DUF1848 domain-containing protein [Clostridia bacterium]|nr:DUF1848 domain-containing protein [Clostridia bacterium]